MGRKIGNIGTIVFCMLFIGLIIIIALDLTIEAKTMIYECTDFQGNLVYCTSVFISKGSMFGITEDGTKVLLTSHKKILKEERKDIGCN